MRRVPVHFLFSVKAVGKEACLHATVVPAVLLVQNTEGQQADGRGSAENESALGGLKQG